MKIVNLSQVIRYNGVTPSAYALIKCTGMFDSLGNIYIQSSD